MAWRDSRGSRGRLVLFVSSMVLGIAALVAIHSFGLSLRRAVDEQAKTLLGADMSFESSRLFTPEVEAVIDSLGGEQSRRVSFQSMALFPRTMQTRLATVRAIEGAYPYYGEVETEPAEAAGAYLREQGALVDAGLMEQFGLAVGDSVRIGRRSYRVAGRLIKTPREANAVMLFSPRIYIPLEGLDAELLAQGSRADYEVYFRFPEGADVERTARDIKPFIEANKIGIDTVEEIRGNWDEGLTNLYRFLSLVGFVALLLGGLGVASAIHVYIQQRVASVAMLRCLGARQSGTVMIYFVQALAMGLVGSVIGIALGLGLQGLLPRLLVDVLPVSVPFVLSPLVIGLGLLVGVSVTVLFSIMPLVSLRRISPLMALRAGYEEGARRGPDPVNLLIGAFIAAVVAALAVVQAGDWRYGLAYAAGLGIVLGCLALVAWLITFAARRWPTGGWSYPWRQGLANLYRPHNQTRMLMLSLGFGAFIVVLLLLVQRTLLAQIEVADAEGRPNLVLFDIQPDQISGVREIVEGAGAPVLEVVPIVTMRLASVKGQSVEEMRKDSTADLSWALTREYRSSYRDRLNDSERLVAGAFVGAAADTSAAVPVSIEEDVAGELGVGLGDSLVFNVQGVPVETYVSSIRKVNWRRVSTNFFVVFPTGVLETAPQFQVLLTRTQNETEAARLQAALVERYPNVSAVDLSLVLSVFDSVFGRIAFIVRFMALFSIVTAVLVLIGAVTTSRVQRVGESMLLKTLGASRRTVFTIVAIEHALLGVFAALTGLVLAMAAAWALARFVFEAPFVMAPLVLAAAVAAVAALTVGVGLLNSRGIYEKPALAVLRAEV